jgi:hypothetical protein
MELQKDQNGNVKLSSVLGWTLGRVAETYVLLAVQYAENEQELETGGKVLQLSLTPDQALQLAEVLRKYGSSLQTSDSLLM